MLTARLLGPNDVEAFDCFLAPHTPFVHHMRSNLRRGGPVFQGQPYQAEYWIAERDGAIVGALAHTWVEGVLCFFQDLEAVEPLARLFKETRRNVPRTFSEFIGPARDTQALVEALGLKSDDFRPWGGSEGLFTLDLQNLRIPDLLQQSGIHVRRAHAGDMDMLVAWQTDFSVEAVGDPPNAETKAHARRWIEQRIPAQDLFILEHNDVPVSFCGVGGVLPDWRSVGPVWTPREHRNKGYARAVVAAALQDARHCGVTQAVLTAGAPVAIRCYQSLGFTKLAPWKIEFLQTPKGSFDDDTTVSSTCGCTS